MPTFLNADGRFECDGEIYRSGDIVVVWRSGCWVATRVEHDGSNYYSVDGFELQGAEVRHYRDHGDYKPAN